MLVHVHVVLLLFQSTRPRGARRANDGGGGVTQHISIHTPPRGATESTETADQFKDLITQLMRMDDIVIEVIGCFVWVTGDTKPHKEQLKALGFKWHSKKAAWYLAPEGYRQRSRREYGLDEIRSMYGTSGQVNSRGIRKLVEESA